MSNYNLPLVFSITRVLDLKSSIRVYASLNIVQSICSHCGESGGLVKKGWVEESILDEPSDGKPVRLVIKHRRYFCVKCMKGYTSKISFKDSRLRMTTRLIKYIKNRLSQGTSKGALARQLRVDNSTISRASRRP